MHVEQFWIQWNVLVLFLIKFLYCWPLTGVLFLFSELDLSPVYKTPEPIYNQLYIVNQSKDSF